MHASGAQQGCLLCPRRARLPSSRSAAHTGRARARQGVPRSRGERHERVRKVVPVDNEDRAVPAAREPAQRQRGDGRRHLPSSARKLTLFPCKYHRSTAHISSCCKRQTAAVRVRRADAVARRSMPWLFDSSTACRAATQEGTSLLSAGTLCRDTAGAVVGAAAQAAQTVSSQAAG
jgi:hypothetical protein